MPRSREHIPTLPAMPPRRRRRRSYRPAFACIIGFTVVALASMAWWAQRRYGEIAHESLRRAEELFQSAAFKKAEAAYAAFGREHPRDARVGRAAAGQELSKIAQQLGEERAEPARTVQSLDEFAAAHPVSEADWSVITTEANRTARSLLEKANRTLDPRDLEAARVWITWLHDQTKSERADSVALNLDELDRSSAAAAERIALEARRQAFFEAAGRGIERGDGDEITQAFEQYDAWRAAGSEPDKSVDEMYARLRQALRSSLFFREPPPGATEPSTDPVPLLPIEAYTLLSTRQQTKTVAADPARSFFVRTKDVCLALDAASGTPRWAWRVGYDAPMPLAVPQENHPGILVPWFRGEDCMISLCDAAHGETVWSWRAPGPLAGVPALTSDALFVATAAGTVWQIDLETGRARSWLELPEPIDGPPTLREDGGGLCLVGRKRGIYLFNTRSKLPECLDVVLIGRRPDTAHCQLLWVARYVVLFENDLMDRCYVRVLHQNEIGYRSVRDVPIELDGRVWRPPVLDGARILLITDHWKEYCFGIDPDNPSVNLYTAAKSVRSSSLAQPAFPYFEHADDVPLLALTDGLHAYRIDYGQSMLVESWARRAPVSEARGAQPLQIAGGLVAASFEEPAHDGVWVQAFSVARGEPIWDIHLAGTAADADWVPAAGNASVVVARDDRGRIFLIEPNGPAGARRSRTLDLPAATSPVRFTSDASEMIYTSDGGARIQLVSTERWQPSAPRVAGPAVASDLAILDRAGLAIRGAEGIENRSGRWAIYASSERSLEMHPLDAADDDIHGVRLPPAKSGDGLDRWSVLVMTPGGSAAEAPTGLIASHPSGTVCRAEARRTGEVVHLFVTACRSDLPQLAAAPLRFTGSGGSETYPDRVLCVTGGGRCELLDSVSLRTVSSFEAGAAVTAGIAADASAVFLGLPHGTVRAVRWQPPNDLEPIWQKQLEGDKWWIAGVQRGELLCFNRAGRITALETDTGAIRWEHKAPAPLALPPARAGSRLMLATSDGGLFFMDAPAGTVQPANGEIKDRAEREPVDEQR